MIYEAMGVIAAIFLLIMGIETVYIHELRKENASLTVQRDALSEDIKTQNNAIAYIKQQSSIEMSKVLKARSDAILESTTSAKKYKAMEAERIGKTCKDAINYGLTKSNSLYECYELNCNAKS